jgi:hypothetical protein
MNWHIEIIAAKLAAVRAGQIRGLIINVPPRYLKSLLASFAFPAWCLGQPERQAAGEFETTAQRCRLATSVGGVLTGRDADMIIIDDPLKPMARCRSRPRKPRAKS